MEATETKLEEAKTILRADHYTYVRNLAKEAIGMILDKTFATRDDLDTWVHETCDGSDRVIYTHKAINVLVCSDSWLAVDDDGAGNGFEDDLAKHITVAAFCALRQDMMESISAECSYRSENEAPLPEGFDLDDEDTWPANAQEAQ